MTAHQTILAAELALLCSPGSDHCRGPCVISESHPVPPSLSFAPPSTSHFFSSNALASGFFVLFWVFGFFFFLIKWMRPCRTLIDFCPSTWNSEHCLTRNPLCHWEGDPTPAAAPPVTPLLFCPHGRKPLFPGPEAAPPAPSCWRAWSCPEEPRQRAFLLFNHPPSLQPKSGSVP